MSRTFGCLGVVAIALMAVPSSTHAINSMLAGEVEQLAPAVRSVQTCGTWHRGEVDGRYRVVVGDVNWGAGQELYVQWVIQTQDDPAPRVVATAAVRELNDDHNQYEITDVRCVSTGRITRLIVRAINEHDEAFRRRSFTIRLKDDGGYTLEPPPRR